MTNATYTDFPFTSNGVKFVSRIYNDSQFLPQILGLPAGVFAQLNIQAVTEIIGDASLLTHSELVKELERVNAGGTQAFILLDEENN